jgi:hypothetical protein
MSIKSQWIGTKGAAFERVSKAFQSCGFSAPRPDESGTGAYGMNILNQYPGNYAEASAIIRWALASSREQIANRWMSLGEIVGRYAE